MAVIPSVQDPMPDPSHATNDLGQDVGLGADGFEGCRASGLRASSVLSRALREAPAPSFRVSVSQSNHKRIIQAIGPWHAPFLPEILIYSINT